MLSTSWPFRLKIAQDTRCLVKATLKLADGTVHELDGLDIMSGSVSFSHSTSSCSSFDIGAAIIGSFSCTLRNSDRRFDEFDFTNATITPYVGMELDDGTTEWLLKGTYWLEQPESYGTTIGLSGFDAMHRLDEVMFSEVTTRFPARAQVIISDICEKCGISVLAFDFANKDYTFPVRPKDDMSCHDALSYICQATGNFARVTNEGKLDVSWYDTTAFESEDWLDGERFDDGDPYESGSVADGGNFFDYNAGYSAEGGTFNADRIVGVVAYSSATVTTDNVVITGIKVTASDEQTEDGTQGERGETAQHGPDGYVLEVSSNPFVAYGQAAIVAKNLYDQMGGMEFRPFDVSCLGDPSVEPGDPILITDYNLRTYRSFITSCTYRLGAYAALSCKAEAPIRKAAAASSAMTRALQAGRDRAFAEKTARELAIEKLNSDLENSSGMYTTEEKDSSGATTSYVHDKPDLKQSQFVWKMNAAGFGMSTDGGKTYAYGIDKWGNAILSSIYAVGINADYITAGSLRVRSEGKTIFCADVKAGQFWWDAKYSSLTNSGELTVTKGNIGGLTISNSSLQNSSMELDSTGLKIGDIMKFDINGMAVNSKNGKVGHIGRSGFDGRPDWKGLHLGLECEDGWFICLGCKKKKEDKLFTAVMVYSNAHDSYYTKDQMHFGCDINMHGWRLRNCIIDQSSRIDGGVSGSVSIPYISSVRVSGSQTTYYPRFLNITLKGGFITSFAY